MEVSDAVARRTSIRAFRPDPVDRDVVADIDDLIPLTKKALADLEAAVRLA